MANEAGQRVVFAGDTLSSQSLPIPTDPKKSLKLGTGLYHKPPTTITATTTGTLQVDSRRHATWIESNNGRYIPTPGDLVITTVIRSAAEQFILQLTPHSPPVYLNHLSFENVSKKTRPQLNAGATVYARVLSAEKYLDTELVCFNPSTGKAEGMGELKNGMVFDISPSMARRLLSKKVKEHGGVAILDLLAEKLNFELAVGVNGRIWIDGSSIKEILAISKAVQDTDKKTLDIEAQRKLGAKLLRELGKA